MRLFRPVQAPLLQQESDDSYQYAEYAPSFDLSAYVACYWTSSFQGGKARHHRILPDGCVDLIVTISDNNAQAFVAGFMNRFEVLPLTEPTFSFGIRFYSDSVHTLLRHHPADFRDEGIELELVWGNPAFEITETIAQARDMKERIAVVEALLRRKLDKAYRPERLFERCMGHIFANKGMLSVRKLAEMEHYSERTVRRTFAHELGVSPKEVLEVVQFQSLLAGLQQNVHARLADLALLYGYADHAHLSKQFKRFYGLAPQTVMAQIACQTTNR